MSIPFERYEKAAAFIRERLGKSVSPMPEVCLVLGSGLGRLAGEVTDPVEIRMRKSPASPARQSNPMRASSWPAAFRGARWP